MGQEIDRSVTWSEGARAGLILGIFTGAFIFLNMLTGKLAAGSAGARFFGVVLNTALWLVKFIGCLWLLRFFMLRFASKYSGVTNRNSFRFGVVTALTSALIVAGLNLLNINLEQETYRETVDTVMQSYLNMASLSDSDRVGIEHMMGMLPMISFFTTMIYCFIFGTVASLVFSRSIPPVDIFGTPSDRADNQDNN